MTAEIHMYPYGNRWKVRCDFFVNGALVATHGMSPHGEEAAISTADQCKAALRTLGIPLRTRAEA